MKHYNTQNTKGDFQGMEPMLVTMVLTLPVTMSSSMDRLCLKDINEGMTDMEILSEMTQKLQNVEL